MEEDLDSLLHEAEQAALPHAPHHTPFPSAPRTSVEEVQHRIAAERERTAMLALVQSVLKPLGPTCVKKVEASCEGRSESPECKELLERVYATHRAYLSAVQVYREYVQRQC